MIGIDPSPPDRQHAAIVSNHKQFKHIKARLSNVKRSQLPLHVDWLLCDANVAPQILLPDILKLTNDFYPNLKGIIMNLKLGDDNWDDIDALPGLIKYIENMKGIEYVKCTQTPSLRQEVVVIGLTNIGKNRLP